MVEGRSHAPSTAVASLNGAVRAVAVVWYLDRVDDRKRALLPVVDHGLSVLSHECFGPLDNLGHCWSLAGF